MGEGVQDQSFFQRRLGQRQGSPSSYSQVDKKAKEKQRTRDWLNEILGQLNDLHNDYEAKLEHKLHKKGGHARKAAGGSGAEATPEMLSAKLEEIAIQCKRIELLLRSLENDALTYEAINDLKDVIDAYILNPNDSAAKKDWDQVLSHTLP